MALAETLTIRSEGLTATISAKGAELCSLAPTGGAELIWSADPQYWGWHAPNLFPIVGAVAGGLLVHEGKSYPIKNHGFLRHTVCAATQDGPDSCSFRLNDDAETRAQYPFAFALTIAYRAEADRLACVWSLRNPAKTPLYASLGLHPAFRWPLEGAARAAHVVLFDEPEAAPIRKLDPAGLIEPEPIATPNRGRVLRLNDTLFDHDALIFDRLVSRELTYGAPGGPAVALEFPDFPELGIWSKPGASPFVCLEPWQGTASPSGFAGEFAEKPGVVALAAGETRHWRYSIRPLAAMPDLPEG
jgi:galactose mutarotase-like enzyme